MSLKCHSWQANSVIYIYNKSNITTKPDPPLPQKAHFSGENLLMANQPLLCNWPQKLPNLAK